MSLDIWHPSNCTILRYDSDNPLNTWIPDIWVSHSPHLEHLRIQEVQRLHQQGILTLQQSHTFPPPPKAPKKPLIYRMFHFC